MKRVLGFVLLMACAPDLRDDYPFDGALTGDFLVNAPQSDGTTLSTIDATSKTGTIYLDLDTAAVVGVGEPWDLAFQRFKISANSGASGQGSVGVAVVKGQDFASLKTPPADGYLQDGSETVFNGIEGGWYSYDLSVHKLVTRDDLFYVVRTEAGFFKLKMKSYYDEAGTAARMQFWWAKVQP